MDLGIDFVSFSFIDNEEVKKKKRMRERERMKGYLGGRRRGQRRNVLTFLSDFEFLFTNAS